MKPDGALFDIVKRVAADVGGQPIIGGVPDALMRLGRGLMRREEVTLLAIDRVLKSSESAALSKVTIAVVNGGVVAWGYEDLGAEDFKKKLAMEGRIL